MRGTYCLIIGLPEKCRIRIGSLGAKEFEAGMYVYVGSALSGMEQRVGRHRSPSKKKRWHIDYLLAKAQVLSIIAIPSDKKSVECAIASLLTKCEGATVPVKGFGSSDCACGSHLLYLGDTDPEWIAEEVAMRISLFPGMYEMKTG
jgi:Uri superfamily endonuclease